MDLVPRVGVCGVSSGGPAQYRNSKQSPHSSRLVARGTSSWTWSCPTRRQMDPNNGIEMWDERDVSTAAMGSRFFCWQQCLRSGSAGPCPADARSRHCLLPRLDGCFVRLGDWGPAAGLPHWPGPAPGHSTVGIGQAPSRAQRTEPSTVEPLESRAC